MPWWGAPSIPRKRIAGATWIPLLDWWSGPKGRREEHSRPTRAGRGATRQPPSPVPSSIPTGPATALRRASRSRWGRATGSVRGPAHAETLARENGQHLSLQPPGYGDAEPGLERVSSGAIGGDRRSDGFGRTLHAHGHQQMFRHLAQLAPDEFVLPRLLLGGKPQGPVPEVLVDAGKGLGVRTPGRSRLVQLIEEEEIDLHRPGQHEHVALVRAQAIPLPRKRLQAGRQVGQAGGDGIEIIRFDPEVPVGERDRRSRGARSHELNLADARVGKEHLTDQSS